MSFTVKEITQEPPSIEELGKMLEFHKGNIKKLLNTSGLLYREMNLAHKLKEMSTQEILRLLSEHGMLVKRPFLLKKDFGLVGFKEAEWSQKFE
jgi:Spx/MgsR family transcriptional regulator